MFKPIHADDLPIMEDTVRSWDLAGTKPTSANPNPDWTRGVLIGIHDGETYIIDLVSCREEPAGVRRLVTNTAHADGTKVRIGLPRDPGQAGKDQLTSYAKMLRGYAITGVPITGNKIIMARPWCADAGNGLIHVVTADWNRVFYAECEAFPQKGIHDDIIDAVSYGHRMVGKRSWRAA
jgi:predicted phage terminase large subunit-like protein